MYYYIEPFKLIKMKLHYNRLYTIFAIVFFGVMSFFGFAVKAQNDTVNPLLSTTGPNVLGQGHIQWNSSFEYYYSAIDAGNRNINTTSYWGRTGLRFGIGNCSELTLNIIGRYGKIDSFYYYNVAGFNPSIGAKLLLYEGKEWLPRVAYYTNVSLSVSWNDYTGWSGYILVQPEIGFQFRNMIGRDYMVDYSLGYGWNNVNRFYDSSNDYLHYSIYIRKLFNNRFLLGAGLDNTQIARRMSGCMETLWQYSEKLQLLAKIGCSYGTPEELLIGEFNCLVGLNWMIR